MAQVKIFGSRKQLESHRDAVSRAVHDALVETLALPAEKRFHRFILLDEEDFLYPSGRSERYTIIEISMFEGRSFEAKKALIRSLYTNFMERLAYDPADLEITLFETPQANWGIRGRVADELKLDYDVEGVKTVCTAQAESLSRFWHEPKLLGCRA
jgi:phenylpyruvate tautomerase PptA (4-oxalocrotonate tautomerase family)